MNRLWRCFGNVVTLLVLAAGAAQSATFVILDSPPGEPLGSGIDRTLTSADGGFSGYESAYGPGVRITFQDANGYWNFEFVAPTGQTTSHGAFWHCMQGTGWKEVCGFA